MASILDYCIGSLDDFIFLAYDSPFRATLTVVLIASLAFSNFWASWIARLQQSGSLNVTSIYDATQGTNTVNSTPGSSSIIQPPRRNLDSFKTPPNRASPSFPSAPSKPSNRSYQWQDGPIEFPISSAELSNLVNPRRPVVAGPPLRGRGGVSFYPSTSPIYRGKSVRPHLWPTFGT